MRKLFFKYYAYVMSGNKSVLRCNINGWVYLNGKEQIGDNVNFNGCKVYGHGTVKFGDNFHSAKGLIFLTTYHNHNGNQIPYDETVIHKNVEIGDNVWLGMNVTVLGGVSIGEGAIIQAGSVVSKSIPPLGIAGGNPAKAFKNRSEEKYYKLKAQKQFH